MSDTLDPSAKLTADSRLVLIRVKVERAKKHLVDLEREVVAAHRDMYARVALREDSPYAPIYTPNQLHRFRVISFDAIAIAGDICQNLRSSLDHLANHLVLVNGHSPGRDTAFPISKDLAAYERDKIRKVEGMRTDAKEAIDRIKPYAGGNDFLWRLHELNNIDKHRLLFTVDRDTIFTAPWIHPFGGDWNTFLMKASEPHFSGVFDREAENQIDFEINETLEQSEIAESNAMLPTLHQLVNVVEDLLLGFLPFLE